MSKKTNVQIRQGVQAKDDENDRLLLMIYHELRYLHVCLDAIIQPQRTDVLDARIDYKWDLDHREDDYSDHKHEDF